MLPSKEKNSVHEKNRDNDITHVHVNSKFKKAINVKVSIQIKFGWHHYLYYDENYKIRSHLPSLQDILKIFF